MLFNSIQFVIFFIVVTSAFFLIPNKYRWILLLASSCYFYMSFVPIYILILGFTIVIDYIAGIYIEKSEGRKRKLFLIMSLIANIGALAFFKYFNFFNENLSVLLAHIGLHNRIPYLSIILPIGLSFHTFQAMSYTIEVYRGNQKAERNFGIYSLYVMFYPQLVAGPIERPQNIIYQFYEKHPVSYKNFSEGFKLILWGLFKKIVIADRISIFVSLIYSNPGHFTSPTLLLAVFLFAFQIYCDFSGYTDIALGTARVMGYTLIPNFNYPFSSKNVSEFWRRWHMSLTTWFNDYLFTPVLLSNRGAIKFGVVFALMVTFSISGLWHGAAWTYVGFGVMHGIAVSYEFLTKKWRGKLAKKLNPYFYQRFCQALTFLFVCYTWIFFRAKSMDDAFTVVKRIFTVPGKFYLPNSAVQTIAYSLIGVVLLLIFEIDAERNNGKSSFLFNRSPAIRIASYSFLIITILLMGVFDGGQFIYFQF